MVRNKLKSFVPLMCQMALLVNICSGSFFFKALGITVLFMAGLPDALVQKETKYRNLDLLQKYYRTDDDAEGELFHPLPEHNTQAVPDPVPLSGKGINGVQKLPRRRQQQSPLPIKLPLNIQRSTAIPPSRPTCPTSQFRPTNYSSFQMHPISAMQTNRPHTQTPLTDNLSVSSSPFITKPALHLGQFQPLYPLYSPYPMQHMVNPYILLTMWSTVHPYSPCPQH